MNSETFNFGISRRVKRTFGPFLFFVFLSGLAPAELTDGDPFAPVSRMEAAVSSFADRDLLLRNKAVGKAVRLCVGIRRLQNAENREGAESIARANQDLLTDGIRVVELATQDRDRLSACEEMAPALMQLFRVETYRRVRAAVQSAQAAFTNADFSRADSELTAAWALTEKEARSQIAALKRTIDSDWSSLSLFCSDSRVLQDAAAFDVSVCSLPETVRLLAAASAAVDAATRAREQLMLKIDAAPSVSRALALLRPLEKTDPDHAALLQLRRVILSNFRFQAGDPLENSIGLKMVYLPAGRFAMGSPRAESGRSEDEVEHSVTLSCGFFIGVCEVTRAQWQAVMQPLAAQVPSDADRPQINISWDQARRFCSELSRMERGRRYRLPTEAEWEYACRAGTRSAFNLGDTLMPPKQAVLFNLNLPPGAPAPVASCPPNEWGLYDMHGNVAEWCSDWLAAYPDGDQVDPCGLSDEQVDPDFCRKIVRGGSWMDDPASARSADRQSELPIVGTDTIGFRVVLEADSISQ